MSNWKAFDFDDRDSWTSWESPGVYAIYGDGRLLYIGQSDNVSKRIRLGHGANYSRFSAGIDLPWGQFSTVTIKIRLSTRFGDWLMHEARLIRRLQPPENNHRTARKRRSKAVS
jgi:hypothetical protein